MRPWSDSERQYMRDHFASDGAAACASALSRPITAVLSAAQRLGVRARPRWTTREDDQLRMLWGAHSVTAISNRIGRSTYSVYRRAHDLDLGCGCPQGHEYLTTAAERTGYETATLRKILHWAGVRIDRAASRASSKRRFAHRGHFVVEPTDVDEAVKRWLACEYVADAAHSRGLSSRALRTILRHAIARGDARVPRQPTRFRHWRVETTLLDELVAARRRRVSLDEAGRRGGISGKHLATWLKQAGVAFSTSDGVDAAAAAAVIESRRVATSLRRGTCRAWSKRKEAA